MRKIICSLLCCMMLVGCESSSKSDAELTDIEQFKCQDSIQMVFDVLGKTEVEENSLIGECCRYENLNLWGYTGEAIFRLRDDKDTISSFECNFELNENEFEDILAQLADKYGEYEKSEYSNQISCVWEVKEEEAEDIGYNRISLSGYGDKKVVVDFSDEWSAKTDEAYYGFLKETKGQEEKQVALDDLEYKYNENTKITLNLFESSGKKKIMTTITCNNSDWNFACLCYMQSAIALASMSEEIDYIIVLDNDGNSFGELRQDGEIQKITESPDFESISTSDEETQKSIEYSEKLDEFIESNNLK